MKSFSELREDLSKDPLALTDIYNARGQIKDLAATPEPGAPVQRVAVAGSLTLEFISGAIACAVVREGVLPSVYEAPFGAYIQEVLDTTSGLHRFEPHVTVLVPDWREITDPTLIGADEKAVAVAIGERVQQFEQMWDILGRAHGRIIQHTLVAPIFLYRGVADQAAPGSVNNQVRALNRELIRAGGAKVAWVAMDQLAESIGRRQWSNDRLYYTSKIPFDLRHLGDYVPCFQGAWRAVAGTTKKVLVTDLDNTLWGGVVGDDGVHGLRLGPENGAEGEAFQAWQYYVRALGDRGVILAVCSKNDPKVAASGFDHPQSVLKLDDFGAFECSWSDKVGGLRRIVNDLNIGMDSVVFVDDNPAETELVRRELPQVTAIDLGTDPIEFIDRLDAGHWFDLTSYTAEDTGRRAAYGAKRMAADSSRRAPDIASFLNSLCMRGEVFRPTEKELERVGQLEMKTNQFNLTTRRYSPFDLDALMADPQCLVLAMKLADRFADHGLTATLVGKLENGGLRIDSWLMSCRIFSRTAEHFMLARLANLATDRGATFIMGEYLASPKNAVVADLYPRLGFEPVSGDGRFWRRDLGLPNDDLATYINQADPEQP